MSPQQIISKRYFSNNFHKLDLKNRNHLTTNLSHFTWLAHTYLQHFRCALIFF